MNNLDLNSYIYDNHLKDGDTLVLRYNYNPAKQGYTFDRVTGVDPSFVDIEKTVEIADEKVKVNKNKTEPVSNSYKLREAVVHDVPSNQK